MLLLRTHRTFLLALAALALGACDNGGGVELEKCHSDLDCKGSRVCTLGSCGEPDDDDDAPVGEEESSEGGSEESTSWGGQDGGFVDDSAGGTSGGYDEDNTCGEPCSSSSDCGPGQACLDADVGFICLPLGCQDCWDQGDACSWWRDPCSVDSCEPPETSTTCEQPCSSNADCSAGEQCLNADAGWICLPPTCNDCWADDDWCYWDVDTCAFTECGPPS